MTKIAWTDESWNPVLGCTKVSEGCQNCYAEKMARRLAYIYKRRPNGKSRLKHYRSYQKQIKRYVNLRKYSEVFDCKADKWNGKIFCDASTLDKPLHWRKPRRIFVVSMGDLFHEKVPFGFICRVFDIIRRCPQHTFQVLTKRPARLLQIYKEHPKKDWPISPNLWLGVSVENQKCADERIPILLQIPAAVRFISAEPLLENIDFEKTLKQYTLGELFGGKLDENRHRFMPADWMIIGCESGQNRRPCRLKWARDIIAPCKKVGIPVFVKQLSINGKVEHDINKFPEDLRLREYPK